MLLRTDDEVYEVDQTYLGPPGHYIGRWRYKTMAIFPPLFMITLVVIIQTHMPITLMSLGLAALGCAWLTMTLSDRITYERPVGALVTTALHEVVARREPEDSPRGHVTHRRARRIARHVWPTTPLVRPPRRAHDYTPTQQVAHRPAKG